MSWIKELKILVLEDNDSDADLILFHLNESKVNFKCKRARNKEEFIQRLHEYEPDIVLSDFSLPGYTGLDALDYLRSRQPYTPFVLVTGAMGEEKAVEMILTGANDFLLKQNLHNLPAAILRSLNVTKEQKARNEAIENLKASERQFRALIENSHDFILVFDPDGKIKYTSPAFYRHLGYSSKEILGANIKDFIHPEDSHVRDEQLNILSSSKAKKVKIEMRWLLKNGGIRWMESIVSDHRGVSGISAFVSNIRDIHDYIVTRDELLKKNELLDSVMKNLNEGVLVTDENEEVLLFNPSARRILGQSEIEEFPNEWLNSPGIYKSDQKSIYQKEELPIHRAKSGEVIQDEEMFIKNKDIEKGTFLNINARPFQNGMESVKGSVISFSDITDRKHYESKLKETLEHLESKVEERTAQLQATHKKLEFAHKQIKYSIEYARRIQEAIVASKNQLKEKFSKSFMIYRAKDVLSGDFIWLHKGEVTHLVVADCTGHGIPGAMMSMIGNTLLDKIVVDHNIFQPDLILEELDSSVRLMIKKKEGEYELNDGMDLSICSFDFQNRRFTFSSAQNIGILFHKGECKILEADRHSIGGFKSAKFKHFKNSVVEFETGDRLYLFTDGFQDQFGGPDSKKFTKKRLIQLLEDVQGESIEKQGEAIEKKFLEWKGKEMQIDDVTLVGIEL